MLIRKALFLTCLATAVLLLTAAAQPGVEVEWDKPILVSKSTPTLQVVVNPPLVRGASIHDASFTALNRLGAEYVRFVPWLPYPRLGVAELQPPTATTTSWDFTHIDPITVDFLEATKGHPVILNFSTVPAWMYRTDKPVTYPANPEEVVWNYTQGSDLVDTTGGQMAGYYARLYSWYTKGGFTDELGKVHSSGYHYDIPYWEVLNEPEFEHQLTPEKYVLQYDAVVSAIRKVSPATKFVGMALAFEQTPHWFEYFLNPANHRPGTPLDMISYHFYAALPAQPMEVMQYTYFSTADAFLDRVRYIESIRKRLSPATRTTIDEVGSILANEEKPIQPEYWNLSGALFAYLYVELTRLGIDVIGESQLVGYPTQYPSVSMMNWKTGSPNARYWVLKLLKDNFGPGDILADTHIANNGGDSVYAQGFKTRGGNRLLLINKRNAPIDVRVPDQFKTGKLTAVDGSTGDNAPATSPIRSALVRLEPFAVAVVTP
ncbi:MAG TPA: hypothetical protein VNU72_11440 [Puia sp.]|jgi:hypothetical protein|nr:hypothetical protein [Puia sp.]